MANSSSSGTKSTSRPYRLFGDFVWHPGQSWRKLIRNQAIGFSYWIDSEDANADHSPLRPGPSHDQIIRFASPIVRT
jgi:hypothetical protein